MHLGTFTSNLSGTKQIYTEQILSFSLLVKDLCRHSLFFSLFTLLGYLVIAGGLYAAFFRDRTTRAALRATHNDIILSIWSSIIFGICAAITTSAYNLGLTRLYLDPYQHSLGYIAFSLALVIFLQDTYFYFTHRLAHHPKLYKWLHQGHHHSKNPTPLTGFAFDPAEALIQSIYLMAVVCIIPMHISVLCAVMLVMSLGATVHHCSLRMFSSSPFGRWLGSWMVGPMHHWYHHRRFTQHYALYFTFWDRLLGTQNDSYENELSPISITDSHPGFSKNLTS